MTERPTEFVVQRSKWLRGQDDGALLLDKHGSMCCLGFVAKQCGAADGHLRGRATPSCVAWSDHGAVAMEALNGVLTQPIYDDWEDTALSADAIPINDDPTLVDSEREAKLTALFAEHGYTLRFEP